jgi:DNA topoisomerase-1
MEPNVAFIVRRCVESETLQISDQREASAADVALIYANDGEPGIRRRRAGMGFCYLRPDGERVRDSALLDRIRGLVIPPAWTDVWIAPNADFHLQVTGKDARGRKQYRYHERWTACRDEVKYSNLIEFARALPRLRKAIDTDLRRRGLAREKVVATVVRLLDTTMIRVGNAAYARDNGSFGLTTCRDRHVRVEGSRLR